MRQLAQGAQTGDVDAWLDSVFDRLLTIIRGGWVTSRRIGDRYLREHARVEGRAVVPVSAMWVPERVIASVRVTGPVEFKRHLERTGSVVAAKRVMADTLSASAQRHALAGDRDTVMATVAESGVIVGWRRVVDADPCAFCALLASRGAVYSKATVGFQAHDGDECTAEPLYEREDDPQSVLDLQDEWRKATAGTSGAASIRAWRRYWDSRNQNDPQNAG
ncbi:hypothetical protein ABZ814_13465 [Micromonospora musae]|uniref:VG15 protein n=1 Tax=Micromonospora musae TaxID=1894970 RepID=UPI0033E24A81